MRNRYKGTCYVCGKTVEVGQGHFERRSIGWATKHAECVNVVTINGVRDMSKIKNKLS